MLKILSTRWKQGQRTLKYPAGKPLLPDLFRGLPSIDATKCPSLCHACEDVCPTSAIQARGHVSIDIGRCLFCDDCRRACSQDAIHFTQDHRLATRTRTDLILGEAPIKLAQALDRKAKQLFGHSLRLRQVSAGGCGACEADINVLGTVVYDMGRFGIQVVASPRHADGIIVTGPVSQNMRLALLKTYEAVPRPKIVIAVGACAISGGPFAGLPDVHDGIGEIVPVDLFIPGCPPHPLTILDGLLRLLNRVQSSAT